MAGFVWGDGGSQLTPEQIAAQEKIAQAMMARGSDYSPVQHWTQGLARVAEAVSGGLRSRSAMAAAQDNAAAEKELLAGLLTPQTLSAPMGNAVQSAPLAAPAASTAGKIYANDEPSPLDPPSGRDRDLAIRTIVGEAANEGTRGQNAVASVIRNRAVNGGYGGDTAGGVVMAPNQFEPWNGGPAKDRMLALSPNDPKYQQAGQALDMAYAGEDPTNGAVNFVAPKAQAALGRPMPAWAPPGQGQDIGNHRFFGSPSPPAAPYQVAGDAVAAPTGAPAGPAAAPVTLPVAPMSGVNPKLLAAMSSPYISDGTKRILGMMLQQQMKPPEYGFTTLPDGTILRQDPRRGTVEPIYTAATKPTFTKVGTDPATGQDVMGFVDANGRKVEEYKPPAAAQAPPSTIPPVPPGVDPKMWREGQSKRATEDAMPASGDVTSKLRNEVQGLPSYKNIAQAAPVYKSMLDAAGRDNRAADVNMIYGMAKIMDPGSVVRESEMTVAQAVATLPQQLKATVESQLTATGRLSPEVRQSIMQEARSRIQAYQGMFDQDAGMYRGIAQRGRMNEADVLPSFGPFDEYKVPPPVSAAPARATPATVDDLVKKYGPK